MILAGYKKGIFVTTSDFQPGAVKAADQYSNIALSIELLNAEKFYDALKFKQRENFDIDLIKELISQDNSERLFYYGCECHRNSL